MRRLTTPVVILLVAVLGIGLLSGTAAAQTRTLSVSAFCPDGWVPVEPSVNPILRCLPGTLVAPDGREPVGPLDCPEGWVPATSPINPVLGCLPTELVPDQPLRPWRITTDVVCPEGWKPVAPPRNTVLGCQPGDFKTLDPREPLRAEVVDVRCPEGWIVVTPPWNPLLRCMANTLVASTAPRA